MSEAGLVEWLTKQALTCITLFSNIFERGVVMVMNLIIQTCTDWQIRFTIFVTFYFIPTYV